MIPNDKYTSEGTVLFLSFVLCSLHMKSTIFDTKFKRGNKFPSSLRGQSLTCYVYGLSIVFLLFKFWKYLPDTYVLRSWRFCTEFSPRNHLVSHVDHSLEWFSHDSHFYFNCKYISSGSSCWRWISDHYFWY